MGPAGGFIAWGLHSVPVGVAVHWCGATWGLLGALSPGGFTQCLAPVHWTKRRTRMAEWPVWNSRALPS